jgi:hypothetical protein
LPARQRLQLCLPHRLGDSRPKKLPGRLLFLLQKSLGSSATTASEGQDVCSVIVDLSNREQHDRAAAGASGVLASV